MTIPDSTLNKAQLNRKSRPPLTQQKLTKFRQEIKSSLYPTEKIKLTQETMISVNQRYRCLFLIIIAKANYVTKYNTYELI